MIIATSDPPGIPGPESVSSSCRTDHPLSLLSGQGICHTGIEGLYQPDYCFKHQGNCIVGEKFYHSLTVCAYGSTAGLGQGCLLTSAGATTGWYHIFGAEHHYSHPVSLLREGDDRYSGLQVQAPVHHRQAYILGKLP